MFGGCTVRRGRRTWSTFGGRSRCFGEFHEEITTWGRRSDPGVGPSTFIVIDEVSREALAVEMDLNLPDARVERIAAWHGDPSKRRPDNGLEFVTLALAGLADRKSIDLAFVESAQPMQNGLIERFNDIFRRDALDMDVFRNLIEARNHAKRWLTSDNNKISHDSLDGLAPAEVRMRNDLATFNFSLTPICEESTMKLYFRMARINEDASEVENKAFLHSQKITR